MWKDLLPVIALRRTTLPIFMIAFEALVIRCRSIDTARALLHVQRMTPRSLMPMWETSRREIDQAYADLLATTESKDQPAG